MKNIFAALFLCMACAVFGRAADLTPAGKAAVVATDSKDLGKFNSIVAKYGLEERCTSQFTKRDTRRLVKLYSRLSEREKNKTDFFLRDGELVPKLTVEEMLLGRVRNLKIVGSYPQTPAGFPVMPTIE